MDIVELAQDVAQLMEKASAPITKYTITSGTSNRPDVSVLTSSREGLEALANQFSVKPRIVIGGPFSNGTGNVFDDISFDAGNYYLSVMYRTGQKDNAPPPLD